MWLYMVDDITQQERREQQVDSYRGGERVNRGEGVTAL